MAGHDSVETYDTVALNTSVERHQQAVSHTHVWAWQGKGSRHDFWARRMPREAQVFRGSVNIRNGKALRTG